MAQFKFHERVFQAQAKKIHFVCVKISRSASRIIAELWFKIYGNFLLELKPLKRINVESRTLSISTNAQLFQKNLTMIATIKPLVFLKQKKSFRLKLAFLHSTYSHLCTCTGSVIARGSRILSKFHRPEG